MAANTAKPVMRVSEFSPALIRVRWRPSTARTWPVEYSRKRRIWCPVSAAISRYQAGTNATSSSPASRLRVWLRSANRHAVGNWPNAGAAAGQPGRWQGQWPT